VGLREINVKAEAVGYYLQKEFSSFPGAERGD
jgi:hypothetical protein